MKAFAVTFFLAPLAACGGPAEVQPSFEQTETAVVAHARCIDETVKKMDVRSSSLSEQMQSVSIECSRERSRALRLNAVPVFEETIQQYDEMQNDLAKGLIASKQSENVE